MGLETLAALHSSQAVNLRELALSNADVGAPELLWLLVQRQHLSPAPCFRDCGLWLLRHLRLGSLPIGCEVLRGVLAAMPHLETLELTRMPLVEAAPSSEQHQMLCVARAWAPTHKLLCCAQGKFGTGLGRFVPRRLSGARLWGVVVMDQPASNG